MNLIVSKDLDELSDRAAALFVEIAKEAIDERGQFTVVLSGGSTPKALYKKLVSADIDWNKFTSFFGDERNVPPEDEQSNYRLANDHLFLPLGISGKDIFRWKTELAEPKLIAADYASTFQRYFLANTRLPANASGIDLPRLDLVLLGMGPDGHTASLFPHTAALQETEKLAVANWVPQLDTWRYTLTFPVINNARNVMFLAAGADKAETLTNVLEGERRPDDLPSQSVLPVDGELYWFLDTAAASKLSL